MGYAVHLIVTLLHAAVICSSSSQNLQEVTMTTAEGTAIGSAIGMLSSRDSERDVSYLAVNGVSLFRIERNGTVSVARSIDLENLCQERSLCCSKHQTPCQIPYTVMVEESMTREMRQIDLRIRILDVNDHVPQFRQSSGQIVYISEKAPVGHLIDIEPAIDGDWSAENQVQRYALQGEKMQQFFEIDSTHFPNLRLKLREQVDYERESSFEGSVEACDRNDCTTAPLTIKIIDVNDNLPYFHPPLDYNLTLPEDASVGTVILTLNATDPDSHPNARMRFELLSSEDSSIPSAFHLDQTTGVLSLARRLQADVRSTYNFRIRVKEASDPPFMGAFLQDFPSTDTSRHDTVSVNIRVEDINDFAPEIRMVSPSEGAEIWIRENTAPGRIATMSVADKDLGANGQVRCALQGGDSSFQLREITTTAVYTLHSLRTFDAEVEPVVFLNITCTDMGTPKSRRTVKQLPILIVDENEFAPVFTKDTYSAKISEGTPNNTFVLQVVATDRDQAAQLEYSLKDGGESYFRIDPRTGIISTYEKDKTSLLDRETTPEVTFLVVVRDTQTESFQRQQPGSRVAPPAVHTAETTVTVELLDENDNAPAFTDAGPFYISENRPAHSRVNGHLHAEDPDEEFNGQVKYSLQDVWDSNSHIRKHNVFQLNETTGTLYALEPLDREQTAEYTLRVVACDMAARDSRCTRVNATVSVVDINDNAPEWLFPVNSGGGGGGGSVGEGAVEGEVVNVTADAVAGQLVALLVAHDRDVGQNGKVRYSLHDPHNEVAFAVNATTGQVTVAKRFHSGVAEVSGLQPQQQQQQQQPNLQPGIYRLRIRASDMGHPTLFTDTWLLIRVVGITAGLLDIQSGLLILLILVSLIIAISLIGAIVCIRCQTSICKSSPRTPISSAGSSSYFATKPRQQTPTPGYILPPAYPHSDYPTFYQQNGGGRAFSLAKPAGSVCSSEHLETGSGGGGGGGGVGGGGGGICPITDMGVTEFYAPYGVAVGNSQIDDQVRFLEMDPGRGGAAYLSLARSDGGRGRSELSAMRLVNAYPVSQMPITSTTELHRLKQTLGSPELLYFHRGNGEGVFTRPEGEISPCFGSTYQHTQPVSEPFEGGSADSGKGVSEDEPVPLIVHCNRGGSSECLPAASNTSTFFCQGSGSTRAPKNCPFNYGAPV